MTESWGDRLFVRWPFGLCLAWISVALISNTFQFGHVVEWDGFGISESTWVVMMGVATLFGVAMAWGQRAWVFPLVVAWTLYGSGAHYAEMPVIATAAAWLVPAGIVAGAIAHALGLRRRRRVVGARSA